MRAPRSAYVTSVTTFDAAGALDVDAQRLHLRRLGDAGVGVYLGAPSPGQGYVLSEAETRALYRVGREELGGRVAVRASGVEPRSAAELIERSAWAADAGLDAFQVYSLDLGHGARPSRQEIERYFRDVLEAVRIPVVLSTHYVAGWFVPLDLMELLVREYPHVIGVTATNPDTSYLGGLVALADALDRPLEVHTAHIQQAITALALGASGFYAAEGNIAPRLVASVVEEFGAGRHAAAFEAHRRLCELFPLHGYGNSVRGWKAAMKILGLPGHHHRLPVLAVDADEEREIAAILERFGAQAAAGSGSPR